ncbi:hypothetical protein ABFA07_005373 [Porites harrisoni]
MFSKADLTVEVQEKENFLQMRHPWRNNQTED